jgi:hypothetical protein
MQSTLNGKFSFNRPHYETPKHKPVEPLNKRVKAKVDKGLNLIVWAISGPVIVWPGHEDMPVPGSVKERISIERLLLAAKGEHMASEVETMWYISCASLINPLDHHWCNIFLYLTQKWIISRKHPLPDFLQKQIILDDYMEERPLHDLRCWLFRRSFAEVKSKAP